MTYEEGVAKCEEIVELIDDEVPDWARDKAPEFFEDIREKVVSVSETIERTGRVSDRQASALRGWEEGVRRWIQD